MGGLCPELVTVVTCEGVHLRAGGVCRLVQDTVGDDEGSSPAARGLLGGGGELGEAFGPSPAVRGLP